MKLNLNLDAWETSQKTIQPSQSTDFDFYYIVLKGNFLSIKFNKLFLLLWFL